MGEAVIVKALRTGGGKAPRGSLKDYRPDDMAAEVVRTLIARTPELDPAEVEDVIIGCATPEAQQGMNMARQVVFLAGLPETTSAITINRYCSSGLQAIAQAAQQIMSGMAETAIGGGTESMSLLPMGGYNVSPNPTLIANHADTYLNMGLTAENLVVKYGISREEADQFAVDSHRKAAAAQDGGKFNDEIVPLPLVNRDLEVDERGRGRIRTTERIFASDEGVRRDTTLEGLGKLRPAFKMNGTVTAGNSSQMTDGAAAALVMSHRRAAELGLKPIARFIAYATGGVAPEEMGIGPVVAIPKALKLAGLNIEDIDLIELNEAFAAQALSVIKVLGLDPTRINVNGGALALGHPLG